VEVGISHLEQGGSALWGLSFEFNKDYWRSELARGLLDKYGLSLRMSSGS
jgi:hypothetical protein